jgi:sortase (surface protein transpeptidase)
MTGSAPDRIKIKKLGIDARIQPVGVMPVQIPSTGDTFVAPAIPSAAKVVGWLNISAPFNQIGNTVLLGSHQTKHSGLYGLWSLEEGDEIILFSERESRAYTVMETVVLSEQEEPIETRRANARYTQFTNDDQLTLVTGGPEEGNVQRTVVIAYTR